MTEVVTLHPDARAVRLHVRRREPLLTVAPGTVVELSTEDCFGGNVRERRRPAERGLRRSRSSTRSPGRSTSRARSPATPSPSTSSTSAGPRLGGLQHLPALRRADRAHNRDAARRAGGAGLDLRDRRRAPASAASTPATSDFTVELPLDPMHGTVGVAPAAGEALMSITPGRARRQHGHPRAAGRRDGVLRGQRRRAALLAIGDGHCPAGRGRGLRHRRRGGDETPSWWSTSSRAPAPPWPRLEGDDFLITTARRDRSRTPSGSASTTSSAGRPS